MGWTEIVVAALAFLGTLAGAYISNRKSTTLMLYRVAELEKKVEGMARDMRTTQELRERLTALEVQMHANSDR